MNHLELVLANGLVVFGTGLAAVLLALRLRERLRRAARVQSTTTPAAARAVAFAGPARVAPSLVAAREPAPTPVLLAELPVTRAQLLRRISVQHLRAVHPAFRPLSDLAVSASCRVAEAPKSRKKQRRSRPLGVELRLVHSTGVPALL